MWTYLIEYLIIQVVLPLVLIVHLSRNYYFAKIEPKINIFYISTPTFQPRQRTEEPVPQENTKKTNIIMLVRKAKDVSIEMPRVEI